MTSVKPPYNSVNPQHNVEVFLGSKMLENMIKQAQEEAAQSWAFARLTARPTKWATRQEAEDNNPGYSFECFAKSADGFWRLAA